LTLYLVKDILFGNVDLNLNDSHCMCSGCVTTLSNKKKEVKRKMWTSGFYFKIACIGLLWVLLI